MRNKNYTIDVSDYDISFKCFYKSIVRNYGFNLVDDIKEDLINEGVLSILENKEQYTNLTGVSLFKFKYKLARNAMCRYIYANKTRNKNICSFDDFDIIEGDLLNFIGCLDNYSLDFKFILESFEKILKEKFFNYRYILLDYFFNDINTKDILKKHSLLKNDFISLIRKFRFCLSDYLNKYGFNIKYSIENDEFVLPVSEKRKILKSEALKDGKTIYFDDCLIYKLMRENNYNYADILGISANYLNKIINRKSWVFKLKTYQIQILRKKFFSTYTFEELLKEV